MNEDLNIRIIATETGAARVIRKTAEGLEEMDGRVQRIARRMKILSDGLANVGRNASFISGGVGAAGAAMLALANSAASSGNAIDKTAKAIGLSAESYQELGFAIGQVSDLSEGQFANAIRQMNTRLGQAAAGSKTMVDAFAKVGVSQEEIASGAVTTEDAFARMVAALGSAASPAEAAALAGALLGEEAAKLGPILRDSGDQIGGLRDKARDLGIVMSDDAVQASAEFTDKMDELQRQTKALRDQIGTSFLPILTSKLIPAIQEKVIPGIAAFAEKIGMLVDWFGNLPGPVQDAVGVVAAALGAGGPLLLALGVAAKAFTAIVATAGPIGLFIGAATLAYTAWKTWGDDITAAVTGALNTVRSGFEGAVTYISEIPARMAELGRNIIDGLRLGILEAWEDLKETFAGLVDWLPNWVKERLEIQSPSQVFARIGHEIGAGLAVGISESAGLAMAALGAVTDGAKAQTVNAVGDILGSMGVLFQGSKKFAIGQALVNAYLGATEALKLPFPANLAAYAKVLATGFTAVRGIRSAQPGGGGGGAAAAGGGTASAAPVQQAQAQPTQVSLNTVGDGEFVRTEDLRNVLFELNDIAGDSGYTILTPST